MRLSGRCDTPLAPEVGLAPTLHGLTVRCATLTLLWNKGRKMKGIACYPQALRLFGYSVIASRRQQVGLSWHSSAPLQNKYRLADLTCLYLTYYDFMAA